MKNYKKILELEQLHLPLKKLMVYSYRYEFILFIIIYAVCMTELLINCSKMKNIHLKLYLCSILIEKGNKNALNFKLYKLDGIFSEFQNVQ